MIAADPSDTAVTPATRRLVLGVALLAALALALPPRSSPANAQPATPAATEAPAAAAGERAGARITIDAGPRSGSNAGAKADGAGDGVKARIVIDAHSGAASGSSAAPAAGDATADERREIVVDRNGRKVRVMGLGGDAEFDSFNDLVRQDVPVLLVLALIWYKMRKNRMLNETMLKLAEKGVVPPADALDAISGNSVRASPAGNALFERAREHSPSTRCSTTARPTASAWCCCSSAPATSSCGGSRTAVSRRRVRTPARCRLPASETDGPPRGRTPERAARRPSINPGAPTTPRACA